MENEPKSSIGVGDKIRHKHMPGFVMEVLAVEPCDGAITEHDSYKIVDPEGNEDWVCAHDVQKLV
jgi:hypothetical protein